MFAPEGEFFWSFVQRCCDLVYRLTNTVHGSIIGIHERRCSDNCFRYIACVQGEEYGPEHRDLWYTACNFGILRGYAINYSILFPFSHANKFPVIPKLCSSLWRRIECETQSNAFWKSMNTAPTTDLLPIARRQVSVRWISKSSVDLPFR